MDYWLLVLTVLAAASVALAYEDVDNEQWTYLGDENQRSTNEESECCPYSQYPTGSCCPQPCCQSNYPVTSSITPQVTCCKASNAKAPVNPADQDIRTSIEIKLLQAWNNNYANIGSKEAKALKALLEKAIKQQYATDPTFKSATVQSFKKGSTVAIVLIINKATSTSPLHYIETAITTGQIGGIKVAKTLKVLEVVAPAGVGLTIRRKQPATQAYYATTPLSATINVDSSSKFRLKFEQVATATTSSSKAALAAKAAAAKAATAKAAAAKAAAVKAALKAAALKKAVSKSKKPTTTTKTTGKKTKSFSDELLEVHNVARKIHEAPTFRKMNVILSAGAQKWATYLTHLLQKGYRLRHSYSAMRKEHPLGENIAYACKPYGQKVTGLDVGKMWYSEAKNFFKWWRNNRFYGRSVTNTKRFLQMVWKGSKNIGIGVKMFTKRTSVGTKQCVVVVTRYYPAAKFYRQMVNLNISKGRFRGAKRGAIPRQGDYSEIEAELQETMLDEDKSIR